MNEHESILTLLEKCELCPRRCKVNRLRGQKGYCGIAGDIIIAHYGLHYGEEPSISGTQGSGTIFFSSCNLRCVFCQNYQISQYREGRPYTLDEFVDIFFQLENQGCHNINLVSPTPYAPFIAVAIRKARSKGLNIPIVYNTNAYENVETLQVLDGLIDIYLPDFKYWSPRIADMLSDVPPEKEYPDHAGMAILEMKRQVGDLRIEKGVARSGVLIRHLVLPGGLAGSKRIIQWIKDNLGTNTFISLMSQYNPLFRAGTYPMINRRIRPEEYDRVAAFMVENGFENVYIQELESSQLFVPNFKRPKPFAV